MSTLRERIQDLILQRWYRMLALTRRPAPWYHSGYQAELQELEEATTFIDKLSETSDVFFVLVRAQYDGFPLQKLPAFVTPNLPIYAYMVAKITSRWGFYRTVGFFSGSRDSVCEVVNPGKDHKLEEVASRHQVDEMRFKMVAQRLRWVWPLLP